MYQNQTRVHFGPLQIGIVLLSIATAFIHWWVAFPRTGTMPMLFYLNGIGYLVLLVALYLPQLASVRRIIRWIFMAFTLLTIILWLFMAQRTVIGTVDKVIEVLLLVLLFVEDRQSRSLRV